MSILKLFNTVRFVTSPRNKHISRSKIRRAKRKPPTYDDKDDPAAASVTFDMIKLKTLLSSSDVTNCSFDQRV